MSTYTPYAAAEPWDLVAEGYAAEMEAIMLPFSRHAIALTRLAPDARVVDVATGPGTLALELAPHVQSVTALDFSERMIEVLRERARAQGLTNVQALAGDGQALPLPAAAFDAGFSMFGWMFFPDRARGLAELSRVLVAGAPLVVSSWAPLARSPLMAAMFGALGAADPDFKPPTYNPDSLENPERLARELRDAGFQDVTVHERTLSLSFPDIDDLWTRMVRGSAPLVAMRKRVGEDVWARRSQLAKAYLQRELGERPRELSTTAWLGFGVRAR